VVAELYKEAYCSQRLQENLSVIEQFFSLMPIIQFDKSASEEFGKIPAELRRIGKLTGELDAVIGAVARSRQDILSVYRQCAIAYTDFWSAYAAVLPSKRHRAVGKETGKTSYIERFNNTLRQRVSRLVRKTLSFSKSLENHIGAIWYFVHAYNKSLLL